MRNAYLRRFFLFLLGCCFLSQADDLQIVHHDGLPGEAPQASAIAIWSSIVKGDVLGLFGDQEPLAVFVARIDLHDPRLELIAIPAEDPDGEGPAEAQLTDPRQLAARSDALLAINTNGFAKLPEVKDQPWREGLPVDILGLTVHAGTVISQPNRQGSNRIAFWIDHQGKALLGEPPDDLSIIKEGINMFYIDLVAEGNLLPEPGGKRHPRTAIGLDATNRWLTLAVVDGRRFGYSVGMTHHELAQLMQRLGCDRAINLDGGGSTIMLAADDNGTLEVVNRPSGLTIRPLPVMLGVRARQ